MIEAALNALGDQIQQACEASGLPVVGFTVITNNVETGTLLTETRTRANRAEYLGALGKYVAAERENPDEGWEPA